MKLSTRIALIMLGMAIGLILGLMALSIINHTEPAQEVVRYGMIFAGVYMAVGLMLAPFIALGVIWLGNKKTEPQATVPDPA